MKTCCTCLESKSLSEFNRHSKTRDGYQPRCRECQRLNNSTEHARLARRNRKLMYRYGMTVEDYEMLLLSQNGVCEICKKKVSGRLDVDHDHSCCPGERSCGRCIRGLLCRRCNTMIGQCEENVKLLEAMVAYLES